MKKNPLQNQRNSWTHYWKTLKLLVIKIVDTSSLVIISLLLLGCSLGAIAQDIESIEQKLITDTISNATRIELLNSLSRNLAFINSNKALEAANEALKLSIDIGDDVGRANSYRNLSSIYSFKESYYISMEYLQRALEIFEGNKDSVGIANCYISLGHTYRRLLQRDKEIFYHKKSFDIFTKLKITERIGVTAHNLGESYLNNGELEASERLTLHAIQINDSIHNLSLLSSCYKVMGILEMTRKNYQQAEKYFKQVLEISSELGAYSQKVATVESLIQLASLYKIRGDRAAHLAFLKKAGEFSQKNDLPNYLQAIYLELILYFSNLGDQRAVQKYVVGFKAISDSVKTRQLTDRSNLTTSMLHVRDLEEDKRRQVDLQQAERFKRRNIILFIALAFALVLAGLVARIYRGNQKIKLTNEILRNQQETIEAQRSHLEELNKTKDKFFGIVAHDLKSPLTSLKSFSTFLINHIDHISKEEIVKMSGQLQLSVDNTIKMADNLITWARLQMKEYETRPEKLFLKDIVSSISEVYKEVAEKKGITVSFSIADSIVVYGDKDQLSFIIRNLVNNAIKFSHKGGFVKLEASTLPNNEIQILVIDNGIGITEEGRKKIFTLEGKQSLNGTAGEKGTGLGLMLSYEFIKLNKGIIQIESQEGKGTTFIIRVKNRPEREAA